MFLVPGPVYKTFIIQINSASPFIQTPALIIVFFLKRMCSIPLLYFAFVWKECVQLKPQPPYIYIVVLFFFFFFVAEKRRRKRRRRKSSNASTIKEKRKEKKRTHLLRQATHESAQLGESDLGRRRSKIENYINLSLLSLCGNNSVGLSLVRGNCVEMCILS